MLQKKKETIHKVKYAQVHLNIFSITCLKPIYHFLMITLLVSFNRELSRIVILFFIHGYTTIVPVLKLLW